MEDDTPIAFDLPGSSFSFGECTLCTRKEKELEGLRRDQAATHANFKTLKQKIIATDQLLRKFKAKTDECTRQEKEIEEWVRKYEKSQREVTVLEAQLRKSLEDMEPVKKAKGDMEKRVEQLEKDLEKLQYKLNQAEFFNNQYEMRVANLEADKSAKDEASAEGKRRYGALESKIKQQANKINKLQNENKILKIEATKQGRKEKRLETHLKRTETKLLKHLDILIQHGLMTKKAKAKVMATANRLDRNEDSDIGSGSDDECLSEVETDVEDMQEDGVPALKDANSRLPKSPDKAVHASTTTPSTASLGKPHPLPVQSASPIKSQRSGTKKITSTRSRVAEQKRSMLAQLEEMIGSMPSALSPLPLSPLSPSIHDEETSDRIPESLADDGALSPLADSDDSNDIPDISRDTHVGEKSTPSTPLRSTSMPCQASSQHQLTRQASVPNGAAIAPISQSFVRATHILLSQTGDESLCDRTRNDGVSATTVSVQEEVSVRGDRSRVQENLSTNIGTHISGGTDSRTLHPTNISGTSEKSKTNAGTKDNCRTGLNSVGDLRTDSRPDHDRQKTSTDTVGPSLSHPSSHPDRGKGESRSSEKAFVEQNTTFQSATLYPHKEPSAASNPEVLLANTSEGPRESNPKHPEIKSPANTDTRTDSGTKLTKSPQKEKALLPNSRRMVTRRMSRLESVESEVDHNTIPKHGTPLSPTTPITNQQNRDDDLDEAARLLEDSLFSPGDLKSPETPGKRCSTSSEKENKPVVKKKSLSQGTVALGDAQNSLLTACKENSVQQAVEESKSPIKPRSVSPKSSASVVSSSQQDSSSMVWDGLREDLDLTSDDSDTDSHADEESDSRLLQEEQCPSPGSPDRQDTEGVQKKDDQRPADSSVANMLTTLPDQAKINHGDGTMSKPASASLSGGDLPKSQDLTASKKTSAVPAASGRLSSSSEAEDTSDLSFSDSSLSPHASSTDQGKPQSQGRSKKSVKRKSVKRRQQLDVLELQAKVRKTNHQARTSKGGSVSRSHSIPDVQVGDLPEGNPLTESSTQQIISSSVLASRLPHLKNPEDESSRDSSPIHPSLQKKKVPRIVESSESSSDELENSAKVISKCPKTKTVQPRQPVKKTPAIVSDSSDSDSDTKSVSADPFRAASTQSLGWENSETLTASGLSKEDASREIMISDSTVETSAGSHTSPHSQRNTTPSASCGQQSQQLQSEENSSARTPGKPSTPECSEKPSPEEKGVISAQSVADDLEMSESSTQSPGSSYSFQDVEQFVPVGVLYHQHLDHQYAARPVEAVDDHAKFHVQKSPSSEFHSEQTLTATHKDATDDAECLDKNSSRVEPPTSASSPALPIDSLPQQTREDENLATEQDPESHQDHLPKMDSSHIQPCEELNLSDIEADCKQKQTSVHPPVIRPEAITLKSPVLELGTADDHKNDSRVAHEGDTSQPLLKSGVMPVSASKEISEAVPIPDNCPSPVVQMLSPPHPPHTPTLQIGDSEHSGSSPFKRVSTDRRSLSSAGDDMENLSTDTSSVFVSGSASPTPVSVAVSRISPPKFSLSLKTSSDSVTTIPTTSCVPVLVTMSPHAVPVTTVSVAKSPSSPVTVKSTNSSPIPCVSVATLTNSPSEAVVKSTETSVFSDTQSVDITPVSFTQSANSSSVSSDTQSKNVAPVSFAQFPNPFSTMSSEVKSTNFVQEDNTSETVSKNSSLVSVTEPSRSAVWCSGVSVSPSQPCLSVSSPSVYPSQSSETMTTDSGLVESQTADPCSSHGSTQPLSPAESLDVTKDGTCDENANAETLDELVETNHSKSGAFSSKSTTESESATLLSEVTSESMTVLPEVTSKSVTLLTSESESSRSSKNLTAGPMDRNKILGLLNMFISSNHADHLSPISSPEPCKRCPLDTVLPSQTSLPQQTACTGGRKKKQKLRQRKEMLLVPDTGGKPVSFTPHSPTSAPASGYQGFVRASTSSQNRAATSTDQCAVPASNQNTASTSAYHGFVLASNQTKASVSVNQGSASAATSNQNGPSARSNQVSKIGPDMSGISVRSLGKTKRQSPIESLKRRSPFEPIKRQSPVQGQGVKVNSTANQKDSSLGSALMNAVERAKREMLLRQQAFAEDPGKSTSVSSPAETRSESTVSTAADVTRKGKMAGERTAGDTAVPDTGTKAATSAVPQKKRKRKAKDSGAPVVPVKQKAVVKPKTAIPKGSLGQKVQCVVGDYYCESSVSMETVLSQLKQIGSLSDCWVSVLLTVVLLLKSESEHKSLQPEIVKVCARSNLGAATQKQLSGRVFMDKEEVRFLHLLQRCMEEDTGCDRERLLQTLWSSIFSLNGMNATNITQQASLCRLFVGVCGSCGIVEEAHALAYQVLLRGCEGQASLVLAIAAAWPRALARRCPTDTTGVVVVMEHIVMTSIASNPAMAKLAVCFERLCQWQRGTTDMVSLISQHIKALQTAFENGHKSSSPHVYELCRCVELICAVNDSMWLVKNFLERSVRSALLKWSLKGQAGSSHHLVVVICRLVGQVIRPDLQAKNKVLTQLMKAQVRSVLFSDHKHPEVERACVEMLLSLSPLKPEMAFNILHDYCKARPSTLPPALQDRILAVKKVVNSRMRCKV